MKFAISVAVSVGQDSAVRIVTCYSLDGLEMEFN